MWTQADVVMTGRKEGTVIIVDVGKMESREPSYRRDGGKEKCQEGEEF